MLNRPDRGSAHHRESSSDGRLLAFDSWNPD